MYLAFSPLILCPVLKVLIVIMAFMVMVLVVVVVFVEVAVECSVGVAVSIVSTWCTALCTLNTAQTTGHSFMTTCSVLTKNISSN